jgi:hypothetical protein
MLNPGERTVDGERTELEVRRDQARVKRLRMACRFLLFCLNHGHSIFLGLHTVAFWVKKIAPFVAKVLVRFA